MRTIKEIRVEIDRLREETLDGKKSIGKHASHSRSTRRKALLWALGEM